MESERMQMQILFILYPTYYNYALTFPFILEEV